MDTSSNALSLSDPGGLLVADAISVGRDLCWDFFKQGFGDAFIPGLLMGAGAALVLGAIAAASAPVAAVLHAACFLNQAFSDECALIRFLSPKLGETLDWWY